MVQSPSIGSDSSVPCISNWFVANFPLLSYYEPNCTLILCRSGRYPFYLLCHRAHKVIDQGP